MTSNPAPLRAAENDACAIASLASGGFARDFPTAGGERVMVAALNRRQFTDLAKATRLAGAFAFAERLLRADFSDCGDLYTHRDTIAALLAAWFARRTMADLAAAFGGTSVPWAPLHEVRPDYDRKRAGPARVRPPLRPCRGRRGVARPGPR